MKFTTTPRGLGLFVLWSSAAIGLGGPAFSQEGGIELLAAETLFDGGTRVSVSHIYKSKGTLFRGSDEVPDALDRVLEEHRVVAAVDHGLRPDLTISALLPFVTKKLESNAGDADSSGVGDMALLAKFRAYKRDWKRGAFHISTIAGIEAPTGETDEKEGGSRLPPQLQPGLGSWNPFFGLSTNLNLDRLRFDALAFYKVNTEGSQDFEKGDFFALEVDAAYRFLHTKYPGPTASAKLGLQWRHEDNAERNGSTVADSGSEELLLRPGLTWHPKPNIDISLAVDVPLYQDFDGEQLGLDYRTFLGIGMRF